jgi:exonuclease SbcC
VRIVAIRGENLASLADRFEIDFEREPLRSAGLFAITGETGAGKSTILDALCLALYDSFPRVDSAGADAGALDSSGQTLAANDPRSILRRGAAKGFAEVDFVGRDGLRYRARCDLLRARGRATGNLQPRARSLRQIDDAGAPIAAVASGVEPVRERIKELTELTFDQFRRTVLLAQGDFDAFLRADSKERAELLEKITGAEIYALISKRVYQRAKEAENAVVALERRLADIRLLGDDERAAVCVQAQDAEERRSVLLKKREDVLREIRRHEAIATAKTRAAQAMAECDAAAAAMDALSDLNERLALLERAEPLRALARENEKARADLVGARATQEQARAAEIAAQEEERALSDKERIAAQALEQSEEEIQRFAPLWSQAESLDAKIGVAAFETKRAQEFALAAQETLREKQEAHARLAENLRRLREESQNARDALGQLSEARGLYEQWRDIEDWLDKRSGFASQCAVNESQLAQLRRDIERCDAHLASLDVNDKRDRTECDRLTLLIEERANALAALNEPEAQERSRRLEAMSVSLGELALTARRYAKGARSKATAAADLQTANHAAAAEDGAIASLREKRALDEARREETERLGELAEASVSEEALRLRASLIEGEPCPVCGARDHPHSHSADAAQALVNDLRSRRDELRAAISITDAQLAQASERAAAARAQEQDARRRLDEAEAEMKSAAQDYARALANWPDDSCAPSFAIEDAEDGLKDLSDAVRKEREALSRKLDLAQTLRADRDALREAREKRAKAIDDRRAERETTAKKRASAETEIASLVAQTNGVRERIESINRSLAPFLHASGLTIGDLDRDAEGARKRLANRGEDYRAASERVAKIDDALAELIPRAASAETQAAEAGKSEQSARERATERAVQEQALREERAGLLGGEATQAHRERLNARLSETRERFEEISNRRVRSSLALATARERAQAVSETAARAEERWNAAHSLWRDALAKAGFEEAACAELLAIPLAECNAMRMRLDAARESLARARATAEERRRDLDEALSEGGPDGSREELLARAAALDEELAALAEKIGADKERLAADDDARLRAGELGGEIDAAKALRKTWSEVNAAIGSASGDKFRRFAQGVTLDHLIALANRHFQALSPRYALERAASDNGDLGLQIVDRDMADERRSTRSLSGGERFLASLALALALCSLEGRDSFVDTLFIDEGFGSLDAATLDIAIDALETLQAQGRRVGVISHVESMHQRIATQIRVEKRGGGKSVVRLSSP